MVTYTWNNIVKYFETIANAHDFIRGFGAGFSDDVEINLEKNENYQFLGIIPRQANPKEQTNEITVGMFVCDLVKTDQRNEAEVLSDTLQTFNDILKIFRNEDLNISLKNEPTLEPFKEKYMDNVAGWMGDLILEVNFASNYCDIPSDVFGTGGTEGGDPQPGSDFITCETLSDCERIVSIVAELNDHEARIEALEQGGSGLTCEDVANCQVILDILGVLDVYNSRISDAEAGIEGLNSNLTATAENLQGQIDNINLNVTDLGQTDIGLQSQINGLDGALFDHISDTNNPHATTKDQVGLGNVDNTSDANKPVSTAQQAALDLKLDKDDFIITIQGYATDTTFNTNTFFIGRLFNIAAATSWQAGRSIVSFVNGTLIGAVAEFSGTPGSNEPTTLSVRLNDTTDLQITASADFSQPYHVYSNMLLNQSLTAFVDQMQLKVHGRTRVSSAVSTRTTLILIIRPTT
jgi:hypothetical protein